MKRAFGVLPLFLTLMSAPGQGVAAMSGDFQHSTPAVSGYDVVSYQTGEKPLRGNGNHVSVYEGETYLFINEDNRKAFERNPQKFAPAYGGFCAYGVSVGKKFVGDPDVWRVVDGRLYLNLDTKIQDTWEKDIPRNIKKANEQWSAIRNSDPASL